MSIYTCFKCPYSGHVFDNKEVLSYAPYVGSYGGVMRIAIRGYLQTALVPAHWLLDLLRQPVFKRMRCGYTLEGTPELPRCPGCDKFFMGVHSRQPHSLRCGHLICDACLGSNTKKKCHACQTFYGDDVAQKCTLLLAFLEQLRKDKPDDLITMLLKEGSGQRPMPAKECRGCRISGPISGLINCMDCSMVTCGGCFVKMHKGHHGEALLELELTALKNRTAAHVIGIFEGYDKNFQHLHASIQEGMTALANAGIEKLKEVSEQQEYGDGEKLTDGLVKLAADFEKQCEVYMPVARQFNDHLIGFKEQLEKKEASNEVEA